MSNVGNSEVVETLKEIFELLNVPRKSTPQTYTYSKKDIGSFLDQMEVVINKLGGSVYE